MAEVRLYLKKFFADLQRFVSIILRTWLLPDFSDAVYRACKNGSLRGKAPQIFPAFRLCPLSSSLLCNQAHTAPLSLSVT
jgi:hypothetical protein